MSKNTVIVREEKKAYVRPQLVKHGNVETLTQVRDWCPSGPIQWAK